MTDVKLTGRDQELAAIFLQCLVSEPKIDWPKFVQLSGLKDKKSAATCWAGVRKKFKAMGAAGGDAAQGDDADDDEASAPAPTAGKKRAAPKAAAKEKAPPKRQKKAIKSETVVKEEDDESDHEA